MKKWPCLVLKQFCNTPIQVDLESEELNEDGMPIVALSWKGKCNYQEKTKRVYSNDKSYVAVNATCLIPGDISPLISSGSGHAYVFNVKREIASLYKARNPDGSVNYTQIDLK